MSKPFVPKAGTTAECAAFTGLENEVVLDEEKGSLIVHDGVTAGGAHEILPKAKNDVLYEAKGTTLPTTGGKMLGDITFGDEGLVGGIDEPNFKYVRVKGSGENAGEFEAFSSDSPLRSGWFVCRARGPNGELYDLYGTSDGKLLWLGNDVLTSAGGTLTDSLTLSGESWFVKQANSSGDTVILGGTKPEDGAYFQATGKDSWGGGEFWIVAKSGTQEAKLQAKPDGSLYWKGVSFRQFCMPNYSAGVEYPWATSNVANTDGWLQIKGGIVADRVNTMQLWIDNVQVALSVVEWNVTLYSTFLVPVCKGSSFYAEGTNSEARLVFYPCVGI